MSSEFMEFGLVASTIGLTGATLLAAYPYEVRKAHKDRIFEVGKTLFFLCHYHGKLALIRVVHHGRWLAWQVTALLPGRYRDR